jgi:hypothetical protein
MFNWNKKEAPVLGLQGSGGGLGYLAGGAAGNPYDEAVFTSSSNWVAPAGAALSGVAALAIGSASGKNGAAMAFGNNIPVSEGTTYYVSVGSDSFFGTSSSPSSAYVRVASRTSRSGPFVSGGGDGGEGGAYTNAWHGNGGGGAGGYVGNGGYGGGGRLGTGGPGGATSGSGGGGAGGNGTPSQGTNGTPGGGTGIFGQGPNGSLPAGNGSIIPSGGPQSSPYQNQAFGAGRGVGGGGASNPRGAGVVRLIWGGGAGDRQFPSTNVNYSPNY